MIRTGLLVIALLTGGLCVMIAKRPSEFYVSRSVFVAAPASSIFPLVNDFHRWNSWSPWEHLDPEMRRTFLGPPSGVGARYQWAGNRSVGEGRMTIGESHPQERITILLEFLKPIPQTARTTFYFRPAAGGTNVEWAMQGDSNFLGKAFRMVVDMDRLIGSDFEKGLAQLRARAERR